MNFDIIKAGLPGGYEILIVVVVVLLLFGGKKIPEIMKGMGKGIREFKNATNADDVKNEIKNVNNELRKVQKEIKTNVTSDDKTRPKNNPISKQETGKDQED